MRFNIEYTNMYELTNEHYEEIFDVLRETISGTNYYDGTICALFPDGVEWSLRLCATISDNEIDALWWDFCAVNDGELLRNNFLFDKIEQLWKSGASA